MFISIITVVFNGGKTIERTIQSVLKQGFKDYEYIVQDGGSKDNTLDIAHSYEDKFEGRLKIYSEKDKGIYDAMNKGIAHAHGDYVWIVNADDYLTENALESIYSEVKEFEDCKYPIIAAGLNMVSLNTLKIKSTTFCNKDYYISHSKRYSMGVSHPSMIVPMHVYNKIGLYDDEYKISADVDFVLRCYHSQCEFIFPKIVVSNMTDGGVSSQFSISKFYKDYCRRLDKFCPNTYIRILFKCKYLFNMMVIKMFNYLHVMDLYIKIKNISKKS